MFLLLCVLTVPGALYKLCTSKVRCRHATVTVKMGTALEACGGTVQEHDCGISLLI